MTMRKNLWVCMCRDPPLLLTQVKSFNKWQSQQLAPLSPCNGRLISFLDDDDDNDDDVTRCQHTWTSCRVMPARLNCNDPRSESTGDIGMI